VSENGTLAYLPVSSYVTEPEVVLVDRHGIETRALPAADRLAVTNQQNHLG